MVAAQESRLDFQAQVIFVTASLLTFWGDFALILDPIFTPQPEFADA
jgi:hypothetical protein